MAEANLYKTPVPLLRCSYEICKSLTPDQRSVWRADATWYHPKLKIEKHTGYVQGSLSPRNISGKSRTKAFEELQVCCTTPTGMSGSCSALEISRNVPNSGSLRCRLIVPSVQKRKLALSTYSTSSNKSSCNVSQATAFQAWITAGPKFSAL